MLVSFADGRTIRGDLVLHAVQRFDLTAIPSTFEAVFAADEEIERQAAEGGVLVAGDTSDRYTVVKARRTANQWAQTEEDRSKQVLHVIAILEGFAALARPLARAVVREQTTMGDVYRSCGATSPVAGDIPVQGFACYVGDVPTLHIGRVLQEEGAVPVWQRGRVRIVRYVDIFAGKATFAVQRDTSRAIESSFLERHEVPRAITTLPAGGVAVGPGSAARQPVFLPRQPSRVLANFSRYLATRRDITIALAERLRAGDLIDLAGVPQCIVTVAHQWASGTGGAGANQVSRLWLGELQGLE